MSVMDLSIQKGLGLSMKSNDYNDNNISIPPYINNHNEQNNAYRLNQEVNNEEITSTSPWDNLHNINTLENLQEVNEEPMEDVNDGHIEDVEEDSVTTMYQENYPYSIQEQNPEAKINNSEQSQFSIGILQTSQMTNLVNSDELQVTQETTFKNDDHSSIVQTQVMDLSNSSQQHEIQESSLENDDNSSIGQVMDLLNSAEKQVKEEITSESDDNSLLAQTQEMDLLNSAGQKVKEETAFGNDDNSSIAQTQVMNLTDSTKQQVTEELDIENVPTSSDQQVTEKLVFENDDDSSIAQPQVMNVATSSEQQVKDEPTFENDDSSSKPQLEMTFQDYNTWHPNWNGYQGFHPNQVANGHSSNPELNQDIKPDLSNQYYNSYGQQQHFGHFQQFYGSYPPNQNIPQPFQPHQQNFPSNPWMTPNGFYPNFGAQSHHYQNSTLWNSYSHPSSQFQYGPNPYMQQNYTWENGIKTEINIKNEDTSDLGSSFNSLEDSINSLDDNTEITSTVLNIKVDKETLTSTENPYAYDWVSDETLLPKGWKKRVYKNGKPTSHYFFLSPTNQKFESKTSLSEYMERNPGLFSQNDIEKLKPNGELFIWIPDETLLPKGWKKRVYKNGKQTSHYYFVSPTNDKFTSKSALLDYMEKNRSSFTESDIYKLRSTMFKGSGSGVKQYSNWDDSDSTLPKGWFKRYCDKASNGKPHRDYQYLSPKREMFASRSAVVLHMRENSYSKEDIHLFLSGKLRNGRNGKLNTDEFGKVTIRNFSEWTDSDPTLPNGWFKRHSEYVESNCRKHKEYQYLSPNQKKFPSRNAVVAFMTQSGQYSQEDIELVLSGRGHSSKTAFNDSRNYTEWTDSDPTLPKGWFKRHSVYSDPSGRKHTEYQYLSPNQQKLTSRNAVVAFMTQSGQYSQEDIELVLSGRGQSGKTTFNDSRNYTEWTDSDPTLPKGWFKRHSFYSDPSGRKHTEYQYLSPNQQKLTSRNAVVAFMTQSGQYSQEDIELVLSGRGHSSRPTYPGFQ